MSDPDYQALTGRQRLLSTNHPHLMYGFAAGEVVVFAVLGSVLMRQSVGGGILIFALGLFAAAVTAIPARWSEKHRDEAQQAVRVQIARRNRDARRHPVFFVVILPILLAADGAIRFNRGRHHPSVVDWVVPAVVSLVVGLAAGVWLVRRARHSKMA